MQDVVGVIVVGGLGRSLVGARPTVVKGVSGLPLVHLRLACLVELGIERRVVVATGYDTPALYDMPWPFEVITFEDGEDPQARLRGIAGLAEDGDARLLLAGDGAGLTTPRARSMLAKVERGVELAVLPSEMDGRPVGGAPAALALRAHLLRRALRGWVDGSPGSLTDWVEVVGGRVEYMGACEETSAASLR